MAVTLEEGVAEIFGTELQKGQRVALGAQKVAIFSWQGATLTLEGTPDVEYTAEDTPMARAAAAAARSLPQPPPSPYVQCPVVRAAAGCCPR